MPNIPLEQWAAKQRIHVRTAQTMAKQKRIPAKKKRVRVTCVRWVEKYFISDKTPLPAEGKATKPLPLAR